MPLNVERIAALAAEDDPTIPELTEHQIVQAATLLTTPNTEPASEVDVA